jgi:hypothetical protein
MDKGHIQIHDFPFALLRLGPARGHYNPAEEMYFRDLRRRGYGLRHTFQRA